MVEILSNNKTSIGRIGEKKSKAGPESCEALRNTDLKSQTPGEKTTSRWDADEDDDDEGLFTNNKERMGWVTQWYQYHLQKAPFPLFLFTYWKPLIHNSIKEK